MSTRAPSRITSVRVTPVSVPTKRPCAWSHGVGFGFARTVLEISTDDGLVGLGECEGSRPARLIADSLGRKLVGLPAHDMAAVWRLCRMDFHDHGSLADPAMAKAYAAVEMAMWDLLGKATEKPVFELLGGAVRPQAEFGAYG
jgi:glucarate dehydratase